MPQDVSEVGDRGLVRTADISGKDRYQLLTSLVVPRPIGWLSTFGKDGTANLAPFSFFAALADTPMLVGVSIGWRAGEPKDTLRNILDTRAFCINVVTESQLEAMNASSGDYPPEVDEFAVAGLPMANASLVRAPYVESCPAVMECRLYNRVFSHPVFAALPLSGHRQHRDGILYARHGRALGPRGQRQRRGRPGRGNHLARSKREYLPRL